MSLEARAPLAGKQNDSCLQYNVPALLKDETRHECKGASDRKQGLGHQHNSDLMSRDIPELAVRCAARNSRKELVPTPTGCASLMASKYVFAWAWCYTGRLGGGSLFVYERHIIHLPSSHKGRQLQATATQSTRLRRLQRLRCLVLCGAARNQ